MAGAPLAWGPSLGPHPEGRPWAPAAAARGGSPHPRPKGVAVVTRLVEDGEPLPWKQQKQPPPSQARATGRRRRLAGRRAAASCGDREAREGLTTTEKPQEAEEPNPRAPHHLRWSFHP